MTLPRLHVTADLGAGTPVDLPPEQAHYLGRVLRLGPGDAVALFNGRDGEWLARIETLGKKAARLVPQAQRRPQAPEPGPWLAFAPLKKAATDFVVEKATELGAARLLPVFTRFTNAGRVNAERLRATAVEAAEQCERLTVPELAAATDLDALLAAWPAERLLLVPDETGQGAPLPDVLAAEAGPAGFLVGPEGGFAPGELDAMGKLPFARRIGLGPRILRAETAVLAALACWQAVAGDWRHAPPPRPDD